MRAALQSREAPARDIRSPNMAKLAVTPHVVGSVNIDMKEASLRQTSRGARHLCHLPERDSAFLHSCADRGEKINNADGSESRPMRWVIFRDNRDERPRRKQLIARQSRGVAYTTSAVV